jgi:hypothetical protein
MIRVYLTKKEKRNLKREAKATGLTMSGLAAHKFIANGQNEVVVGNPPRGRKSVFAFSVSPNLRGRIEFAALQNETNTSWFVRELVVNN